MVRPGKFIRVAAAIVGGAMALVALPLYRFADGGVALGVLAGILLAAAGALSWLGFLVRAWDRSYPDFLKFFLGGVLFRLALFVSVTVGAILSGILDLPSFLGSLFLFYLVFQVLEIRSLQEWTAPSPRGPEADPS